MGLYLRLVDTDQPAPSQPREKGRMRFHKLQNVQIALDYLRHRQVRLPPPLRGPPCPQLPVGVTEDHSLAGEVGEH